MVVVLFSTQFRNNVDMQEYNATSKRMNELVRQIPGFISIKEFVSEEGEAVAIARFESEEALEAWRQHPEHVKRNKKELLMLIICLMRLQNIVSALNKSVQPIKAAQTKHEHYEIHQNSVQQVRPTRPGSIQVILAARFHVILNTDE